MAPSTALSTVPPLLPLKSGQQVRLSTGALLKWGYPLVRQTFQVRLRTCVLSGEARNRCANGFCDITPSLRKEIC